MINTQLLSQLRSLTNAGMKDCSDALKETSGDINKAVDWIKVKGKAIADSRSSKQSSEGIIALDSSDSGHTKVLVEINSSTDFCARNSSFLEFAYHTALTLLDKVVHNQEFAATDVEERRQEVVSQIKENIVVRRWWAEQATHPNVRVFSYLHSNNKIGVLLSLHVPDQQVADSQAFNELGNDLCMQVCAMAPLAVSVDRIPQEDLERQTAIFKAQLIEENKPAAMWEKILNGKLVRWNKEICLLDQESVIVPKKTVRQVIEAVNKEISVVNFHRCEVGQGLVQQQTNLTEEVAKLIS